MAAIAGELSKQIKGHSEGAQGFRPWWDTVEDNLMYAFVILGKITKTIYIYVGKELPLLCPFLHRPGDSAHDLLLQDSYRVHPAPRQL